MKDLIDYSDYDSVRKNIFDSVHSAVSESFPLANDQYSLKLNNVRYTGPEKYSKADQKKAILENRSLSRRLVGDWQVHDSVTGKPMAEPRTTTVMNVPWLSERGTFIRNGVEYVGLKQLRLDPNVYTRKTEDGRVESQFNVKPRTGASFRLFMDPKTSHFYMTRRGRKVPLYPILRAMGIEDKQITKSWGEDITKANRTLERSPYAVNWLKQFSEVQQKQASIPDEQLMSPVDITKHNLLSEFTKAELDPDNTQSTLGQRFDRVTPESMLSATQRILGLSRGEGHPDDRDSLEFQTVHDFSDFMADSVRNDQNQLMKNALWKITGRGGDISKLPPSYLDKYVDHLFDTSLMQGPEEISPIDIYDQNQRVTRLGPGALPSLDVVPKEARSVQPSYLGYIDPVRAPECYVAGMEVFTSDGWIPWPKVNAETEFATRIDKALEFHKAYRLMNYFITDEVYTYDDPDISYAVTHNHRMWVGDNRTSRSFEFKDARHAHMTECYINTSLDGWRSMELVPPGFETHKYSGDVYCAEVPGGILYVRTPGKKGFWCGNSLKIGVDLKFARGVRKGKDNRMYTQMFNPRTNKTDWVSSKDAARAVVAFPEALKTNDRFVPGIDGKGLTGMVDRKDIDYIIPNGGDMFSTNANMVPMVSGIKGMRLLMGSKHISNAMPLVQRESPLVMTNDGTGKANEDTMGKFVGAVRASQAGVVKQVRKNGIIVKNADGTEETYDMYDNHPYSRKTSIRNNATVKAGDQIKKGGLLATSNFTDDQGRFAGGSNLRVGFMNAHGYNFEDGVVISEGAARKMTSEHMYKERIADDDDLVLNKKKYMALFPGRFSKEQMATIGDDGMVKPGTVLKYGDPMFAAYKHVPPTAGTAGRRVNQEGAQIWKHHYPAVVTDTARGKKGWQVLVRSNQPMQVGDKLAGRFGNKGTVARILPDDQMIRGEDGEPLEILMNANGIPSRTNSSQMIETQLAKVAKKTGKPIIVDAFEGESLVEKAKSLLAKHGLKDRETVYDPVLGKKIPKVMTGPMYIYKQQHTSEGKGKARAQANYTQEGQPAKGGKTGAKHFGSMEQQALLAHGAEGLIKDLKLVKGQKNDDFWRDMKAGRTPVIPGSPQVYTKFRELIKASGINLREDKDSDHIFAMTNDDILKMTGDRELTSSGTFRAGSMKPVPGGLFDTELTGQRGTNWAHIKLPEPILNPISEDVVRSLLDVRKKDLDAIISGEEVIDGKRGGHALKHILSNLNLPKMKADAAQVIKEGSKSKRDAAVKRFSYINALMKEDVKPEQFLWDRIPVLPPSYRPITNMNGMNMVADPNYLYKATMDSVKDFKDAKEAGLGDEGMAEARRTIVSNVRALIGTADPIQDKLKQKNIKGILQQVVGKGSPKHSLVQRRVLGTNTDVSGMAVITPNPSLKMNQVGLPEKQAWQLYEPYIQRELVRRGYGSTQASEMIEKHDKGAYNALQKVVSERPIIYNRAPTLHKYSIQGAWPVLTKGTSLQIHPAIVGPFNADFDGDMMSFAVPTTEEATRDVLTKMMPDKLLLSERDDKPNFLPMNEYVQGLYLATKKPRRSSVKKFATMLLAKKAYARGEIRVDDPIEISEKR